MRAGTVHTPRAGWCGFGDRINLNGRMDEHPLVSTLHALAAIHVLFALCAFATRRLPAATRWLGSIGQCSLFILLFHYRRQDVLLERFEGWAMPLFLPRLRRRAAAPAVAP